MRMFCLSGPTVFDAMWAIQSGSEEQPLMTRRRFRLAGGPPVLAATGSSGLAAAAAEDTFAPPIWKPWLGTCPFTHSQIWMALPSVAKPSVTSMHMRGWLLQRIFESNCDGVLNACLRSPMRHSFSRTWLPFALRWPDTSTQRLGWAAQWICPEASQVKSWASEPSVQRQSSRRWAPPSESLGEPAVRQKSGCKVQLMRSPGASTTRFEPGL
mmetsp:Transcript_32157/g.81836  ORF Transcript_32157/g.81836 Transcript_32157/m.81836 type:complete len:212 (-) Transcript_32157:745-1380(-)